jgi:hypothetical protein
MDTAGAMTGPLLAFGILSALPGSYEAVFVTSFCFALVGVAVIALLLRDREVDVVPLQPATRVAAAPSVQVRDALSLLRRWPRPARSTTRRSGSTTSTC